MSWLRIDDGFTEHPKLVALGGPSKRWAWIEILAYCARRKTKGHIPDGIGDIVRRATPDLLKTAEKVGLIDVLPDNSMRVHDWEDFNPSDPTKATRQAKWRANRNGRVDAPVDGDVDGRVDSDVDTPSPTPTPTARGASKEGSSTAVRNKPNVSLEKTWTKYLAGHAWDETFSADQILDEFRHRRLKYPGELTEEQALEQWHAVRAARYEATGREPTKEPA